MNVGMYTTICLNIICEYIYWYIYVDIYMNIILIYLCVYIHMRIPNLAIHLRLHEDLQSLRFEEGIGLVPHIQCWCLKVFDHILTIKYNGI